MLPGPAAFFIDASLFRPGFEDPGGSAVAGKTGYSVIPVDNDSGESFSAHWQWGLGIPKNAPNAGAGWYFIQGMTNKDHEPAIGTLHGGAPRLSTWNNASYADRFNPGYVSAVAAAWVFAPTFEHNLKLWEHDLFHSSFTNSLIITSVGVLLAMALAVPAAHALTRLRVQGSARDGGGHELSRIHLARRGSDERRLDRRHRADAALLGGRTETHRQGHDARRGEGMRP